MSNKPEAWAMVNSKDNCILKNLNNGQLEVYDSYTEASKEYESVDGVNYGYKLMPVDITKTIQAVKPHSAPVVLNTTDTLSGSEVEITVDGVIIEGITHAEWSALATGVHELRLTIIGMKTKGEI